MTKIAYALVVAVLVILAFGSLGAAVQAEHNAASWKLLTETQRMQACQQGKCYAKYERGVLWQ